MTTTATDYSTTITVSQSPTDVFNAINNVRGWWTIVFEGSAEKRNDVFTVRFGETFITSKVIEMIPGKKTVWQVIDCYKHWLKNKKEWMDTQMIWEVSSENNATQIRFTHIGLVPDVECYNGCERAWNSYIQVSLYRLMTEGKGAPDLK